VPVYNYNMHPYFGLLVGEKKKKGGRKQRKWLQKNSIRTSLFGDTQKTMTWSSLQKCHSIHRPRNDQFFQWTLLAFSHCKIMDTVRYPLHPTPRLLKEHHGRELRSTCEELELNWSFLLWILLSHFQSRKLQRCHKQAGCYSSRYWTSNSCSLFFEFRSHS